MDLSPGGRLKKERERLGYSQTAFAALVGASKHAQINWEKSIASPNAAALATWAKIGVDILYVITGASARVISGAAHIRKAVDVMGEMKLPEETPTETRIAIHEALFNALEDSTLAEDEWHLVYAYRRATPAVRAAAVAALLSQSEEPPVA